MGVNKALQIVEGWFTSHSHSSFRNILGLVCWEIWKHRISMLFDTSRKDTSTKMFKICRAYKEFFKEVLNIPRELFIPIMFSFFSQKQLL